MKDDQARQANNKSCDLARVSRCLHKRSIRLSGLTAKKLSYECTFLSSDLLLFFSLFFFFFLIKEESMQGRVSSWAHEWGDTGWSLSHRLNAQQVGDTQSRLVGLISGAVCFSTSPLFPHPPPAFDRWWCLTHWTISFYNWSVIQKNKTKQNITKQCGTVSD